MANTSAIRQQAAHPTYQLYLLAAQQEPYKKSNWRRKMFGSFGEKSPKNGPLAEKWQERKSRRAREKKKRGDRTRQWNDSLESPHRGQDTSDIPGLPSGTEQIKCTEPLENNTNTSQRIEGILTTREHIARGGREGACAHTRTHTHTESTHARTRTQACNLLSMSDAIACIWYVSKCKWYILCTCMWTSALSSLSGE